MPPEACPYTHSRTHAEMDGQVEILRPPPHILWAAGGSAHTVNQQVVFVTTSRRAEEQTKVTLPSSDENRRHVLGRDVRRASERTVARNEVCAAANANHGRCDDERPPPTLVSANLGHLPPGHLPPPDVIIADLRTSP